ncbi:MAG: Serine protease [Candidatus Daviesbacteria bacterium GW2011_GWA2_38_24]|uniref:Serine protease n=1 Tax=Candidatus Daviesbacteria bacterium GW2011_GWA2_38_24 TaxID=1618422 RepID=A0A0G0JV53_9BACT|nr:MAG: Serine protease [Candidatus Daviesbacteria bacterium GW2011_GWA2_38_24]KKQ79828.1 MAG: Serine protease [Candidatus Daviesbacteria bacterium GW2011_GWA1_38_7]
MIINKFRYIFVTLLLLVGGVFLSQAGFKVNAQEKLDVIPNNFIVVLKDNVGNPQDVANEMARTHGLSVEHVYTTALKGFSATIPQARLDKVKGDGRVQFVSGDRIVEAFTQTTPTGISRVNASANTNKGTGVGVAVIDTGIDLTHPDLQANIVANKSCIRGKKTGNDDNGHGSHVAGTIAALNNSSGVVGVAPGAKLVAVKVLNSQGSGTWSSVICGIDWVTANATKFNIKVANMSLGGGGSSDNNCGDTNNDALHKAICKSTNAGVTYTVAAGNSSADASTFVPAAYDDTVITVSALADSDGQSGGLGSATSYGADDTFASFSNYGSVVDLGAPGVSIYSTWKSGGYNTINGTSMASPHVAGSAALYIKSHPGSTWSQVRDGLVTAAESLNAGHSDPSGLHVEPVVQANSL